MPPLTDKDRLNRAFLVQGLPLDHHFCGFRDICKYSIFLAGWGGGECIKSVRPFRQIYNLEIKSGAIWEITVVMAIFLNRRGGGAINIFSVWNKINPSFVSTPDVNWQKRFMAKMHLLSKPTGVVTAHLDLKDTFRNKLILEKYALPLLKIGNDFKSKLLHILSSLLFEHCVLVTFHCTRDLNICVTFWCKAVKVTTSLVLCCNITIQQTSFLGTAKLSDWHFFCHLLRWSLTISRWQIKFLDWAVNW